MAIDPKRVKEIFLEAAELPDEAARAAYLDKACGADAAVRERVEALLRSHDPEGSFLRTPAAAVPDPNHGADQTFAANADAAAASATEPAPTEALSRAPDAMPAGPGSTMTATEEEPLTFLAPSQRPDSLGRIGHYEALQILGRGGFGIVFRAFDEMLQRVVALKVMAPQLAATSPARKRFLREARSSAQVRHENVVQVYEVAEQPLPYLAMEFIPGETLQQKLDRVGPLDVAETLRIGRQIAEGLAAAHATDLIHRDIKPGNVLLEGGQHKVKITDFGLARAADDASLSQSGIIAGTPMYMAPEQALGETLDQRADLFSLGSVLYQMVAGRPPFRANNAVAVLKRVAEDRPRAIREIIPETPPWLCDIIAKLHAKNPDDRYQSAREVADVLADCEAQLKVNAKLKDFSRIPRSKPAAGAAGWWKWAAAAALLLPVLSLALTEITGATHLLRGWGPMNEPFQGGKRPEDDGPPPQKLTPARLKYGDAEYTNTLGMKFKLIPAGKFTMGSSPEEIDRCLKQPGPYKENLPTEGPEHPVEITQPFYLGATEVTVGQFRQFVEEEAYQVGDGRWRNPGFDQTDQHPVVFVSWNNAVDFCKWLSKKEGKEYRLPTEAEWEYSCRAGKSGSRYCFGDDGAQLENYAWYSKNSGGGTHPVGKKKPNAWGLYDMHGNAWEWCQDNYDPDYYKNSPVKDPPGGAENGARAGRGGGWLHRPVLCRSAFRGYLGPDDHIGAGFRVLLVSPPAGPAGSSLAGAVPPGAVLVMNFAKDTFYEKDGKMWVRDLSGRGNDGACEGVSFTPDGKVGGGLACQGGALRIPHSLINGQANYTITGWYWSDPTKSGPHGLYWSGHLEPPEPVFMLGVPLERSIFVNAWNKDHDQPHNWLGVASKAEVVPEQGWCFFAVTLRDGGVGRGTLQVSVNETNYPLNSQMVKAHDGISVSDCVIANKASGTVIDELAVFQRALSDDEIRALRELGRNNVPLLRAGAVFTGNDLPLAADAPTDLIPFARPDLSRGRWESRDGKLVHPARDSGDYPALTLAVRAPDDFDLEAEFERTSGDDFIGFGMSSRGHDFMVALDTYKKWAGLQAVAGKLSNANPTRRMGPWLTTGRRHTLRCEIRASGVRAWLDAREVVDYRGGYKALRMRPPALPDWAQFFIQANDNCGFVVHKLVLTPRLPAPGTNTSFDAKEAQQASAKQLGIPVETINSIGMKLRLIPPGKFTMGSSKEEIDYWRKGHSNDWFTEKLLGEGPPHEVELTQPFYLGKAAVTVGQFRQFVQATGYHMEDGAWHFDKWDPNKNWLNPGFAQADDHPVVCVSWNDAEEFCKWLNKKEGKTYRLPTEAEWEYSCRAGSKGRWSCGDSESELLNYARFYSNSQGHTWPVAGLKENAWGLHDMHGNVFQWCQDLYDVNSYKTSPPKDPPGPGAGGERVLRGGSWCMLSGAARSAFRVRNAPGTRCDDDGFRVVLVISPSAGVRTENGAKGKTASTAIPPFTDADVQRIAALPAAQQVEEVRRELKRRNPGFDGKMETKIEGGIVTEFRIETDKVTNIAPIRVFDALRVLECSGSLTNDEPNGQLADLTPLKEMNLSALTYLVLWNTKVDDAGMAYFKDCNGLTGLGLNHTNVSDAGLVHFKNCKGLMRLGLVTRR